MTRFVLVRHAESTWNAEGRWQGWADPPLTPGGEDQARRAASRLAGLGAAPELLAASDLRRARRTAELIASGLRPPPQRRVDPDFREYDAGEWTGLRHAEIAAGWPDLLAGWDAGDVDEAPGGEHYPAFTARLLRGLGRLRAEAPDGTVAVISHGRAVNTVATALGGEPAHIAQLTGWELDTGRPGEPAGGLRLVRRVTLAD